MSKEKHIKDFAKAVTTQELLEACLLCQTRGPDDCDSCPYQEYENCYELNSHLLYESLQKNIALIQENKELLRALKTRDANEITYKFCVAYNKCLSEIENELHNQIRKYLNSLDATGHVTQLRLNKIIKDVVQAKMADI